MIPYLNDTQLPKMQDKEAVYLSNAMYKRFLEDGNPKITIDKKTDKNFIPLLEAIKRDERIKGTNINSEQTLKFLFIERPFKKGISTTTLDAYYIYAFGKSRLDFWNDPENEDLINNWNEDTDNINKTASKYSMTSVITEADIQTALQQQLKDIDQEQKIETQRAEEENEVFEKLQDTGLLWICYGDILAQITKVILAAIVVISGALSLGVLLSNIFMLFANKNTGKLEMVTSFSLPCNLIGSVIGLFIIIFSTKLMRVNHKFEEKIEEIASIENNYIKIDKANGIAVINDFKFAWGITWVGFLLVYILRNAIYFRYLDDNYNIHLNVLRYIIAYGMFMCFVTLYFKKHKRGYFFAPNSIFAFCGLMAVIVIQVMATGNEKNTFFDILALGCLGITISLFTARLEGRIIGTSVGITTFFHIYAVTMPLHAFGKVKDFVLKDESLNNAIFAFSHVYSLFGKTLLFLFVWWLIDSGKLLLYIVELRKRSGIATNNNTSK